MTGETDSARPSRDAERIAELCEEWDGDLTGATWEDFLIAKVLNFERQRDDALTKLRSMEQAVAKAEDELPAEDKSIAEILTVEGATEIKMLSRWEPIADLRDAASKGDAMAGLAIRALDEKERLLPLAKYARALRQAGAQKIASITGEKDELARSCLAHEITGHEMAELGKEWQARAEQAAAKLASLQSPAQQPVPVDERYPESIFKLLSAAAETACACDDEPYFHKHCDHMRKPQCPSQVARETLNDIGERLRYAETLLAAKESKCP